MFILFIQFFSLFTVFSLFFETYVCVLNKVPLMSCRRLVSEPTFKHETFYNEFIRILCFSCYSVLQTEPFTEISV
jgi:hypothetical protein